MFRAAFYDEQGKKDLAKADCKIVCEQDHAGICCDYVAHPADQLQKYLVIPPEEKPGVLSRP